MDNPLGQDRLLDSAPLCAAVLDVDGKPAAKVFTELLGPLFKFSGYPFEKAPWPCAPTGHLALRVDRTHNVVFYCNVIVITWREGMGVRMGDGRVVNAWHVGGRTSW